MESQSANPLRKLWIKFQRLSRAPSKKKFYVGLCVAGYLIVSYIVWKYHSEHRHNAQLSVLRKSLLHYCNPPGLPLGNEHNEPLEYAQFKLKQVQVVVRHGDRSSVAENFAKMVEFNCDLNSQNSEHAQKLEMLKKVKKFLRIVHVQALGLQEMQTNFMLNKGKVCRPGQLTGKGYLQHIYLGEYMFKMYGRRLDINVASVEEGEIMVFATPIKRTQQSAAAFIAGMLEKVFQKIQDKNSEESPVVNIRVSNDALGYFREDENNEISSCFELERIIEQRRESDGMATFKPLLHQISQVLNISTKNLPPLTHVFDMVVTHFCHHHPPPCGPTECIDDDLKLQLVKTADSVISSKYTATATLVTHPLLSKIAQRMLTHASGEGHTKFVLFATHDSTIAPLLIEMGIFYNQWPAFASRIVFELWEAGGLLGSKLNGEDIDKHFIRILYDGHDLTRKVKFCKENLKFGKLCPLRAFVKALEGTSENMDVEYHKLCAGTSEDN